MTFPFRDCEDPSILMRAARIEPFSPAIDALLVAATAPHLLTIDQREIVAPFILHEPDDVTVTRALALVAGRRGGKTSGFTGPFCVWHALSAGHEDHVLEGSAVTTLITAPSRRQAREELGAVLLILDKLKRLGVEYEVVSHDETTEVRIDKPTARAKRRIFICAPRPAFIRGLSIGCAVLAEAGFLASDGSPNSDRELLAAVSPATLTFPRGQVLLCGSPGAPGSLLERTTLKPPHSSRVFRAATWDLNPRVSRDDCIAQAHNEALGDPLRYFKVEFEASLFASTAQTFAAAEDIRLCVDTRDRSPRSGGQFAAVGFDLGLIGDSTAIVVAMHETLEQVSGSVPVSVGVVLESYERRGAPGAPLSLADMLDLVARTAWRFPTPSGAPALVLHDAHYGSEVQRGLRERGIESRQVQMTPAAQTERFGILARLIRGKRLSLPDLRPADAALIRQLGMLRVETLSSGLSRVEGRGSRDDLADAACLAVEAALELPATGGRGVRKIMVPVAEPAGMPLRAYRAAYVDDAGNPAMAPIGTAAFIEAMKSARSTGAWGVDLMKYLEKEAKARGLATIEEAADALLNERTRHDGINGKLGGGWR